MTKMNNPPCIIQKITLVTYSGKQLPLAIMGKKIIDIPIKLDKSKIIDAFSSMKDKPVDVKLKVSYI